MNGDEARRAGIFHVKSAALATVCAGFLASGLLFFFAMEEPTVLPEYSQPDRPDRVVQALMGQLTALRADGSAEGNRERVRIIRALADLEEPAAQERLKELAFDSEDDFERLTALNVLWASGQHELLISRAREVDDPLLQAKVRALQSANPPDAK